jgi:predicted type IV restriction endonuclease
MDSIPAKVSDRIRAALKQFQPILTSAKTRDVNESDTVVIVTDLLQAVFGYDKYSEITTEHLIRGTFCDLAIKLDGKLALLIEVKAIGIELKDPHVKQAIDYAANQGLEWVGLTNGAVWRLYKLQFEKPISFDRVVEFNLLELNLRASDSLEVVGLLAKECWQKSIVTEYYEQRQALSRFTLGALLLTDTVVDVIRRELRRVVSVKVDVEELRHALQNEVLKREVFEGDKATAASRQVSRAMNKSLRKASEAAEDTTQPATESKVSSP